MSNEKVAIIKCIEELGLDLKLATINEDGSVDYRADVNLNDCNLEELPIKFGKIDGDFTCSNNHLKTLKNAPHTIAGDFTCTKNQLSNLKYGPTNVGRGYYCGFNNLVSLEGAPKIAKGNFDCTHNNLITLEHGPEIVGWGFGCSHNKLKSLKFGPTKVKKHYSCNHNELTNLEYCPKTIGSFLDAGANNINTLKYFPEKIGGYATMCMNEVQNIDDLSFCTVKEYIALGWKNQTAEKNIEQNLRMKNYSSSELALKFKTDEVIALEKSLIDDQNSSKISTKRKLKL